MKNKSYKEYLDEQKAREESIMRKYGAPLGAKPPKDRDFMPAPSDRHYRKYAFTYKTRLEEWPKSIRRYP